MVPLLKVPHLANSVVILSRATRHLNTLGPVHNIQASMALRLQGLLLASTARLPDSMVHHPQVLLPGNISLQPLISKRLRDLRHHPALATSLAKSQTLTCLARQKSSAKP
jgi:hypothetical protein